MPHAQRQQVPDLQDHLGSFLNGLNELSRQHGIAVADGTLYEMEGDDFAFAYAADDSKLTRA